MCPPFLRFYFNIICLLPWAVCVIIFWINQRILKMWLWTWIQIKHQNLEFLLAAADFYVSLGTQNFPLCTVSTSRCWKSQYHWQILNANKIVILWSIPDAPASTTQNIGCPSIMTPSKMGKTKKISSSILYLSVWVVCLHDLIWPKRGLSEFQKNALQFMYWSSKCPHSCARVFSLSSLPSSFLHLPHQTHG